MGIIQIGNAGEAFTGMSPGGPGVEISSAFCWLELLWGSVGQIPVDLALGAPFPPRIRISAGSFSPILGFHDVAIPMEVPGLTQ